MTQKDVQEAITRILESDIVGFSTWEEKVTYLRQVIVKIDIQHGHDESNKGKPWSDDELRMILQLPPTKENILRLSRAFKRGYGSIEQIYRWASEDTKSVKAKRPDDAFVRQIKRVAKEVGWRAT